MWGVIGAGEGPAHACSGRPGIRPPAVLRHMAHRRPTAASPRLPQLTCNPPPPLNPLPGRAHLQGAKWTLIVCGGAAGHRHGMERRQCCNGGSCPRMCGMSRAHKRRDCVESGCQTGIKTSLIACWTLTREGGHPQKRDHEERGCPRHVGRYCCHWHGGEELLSLLYVRLRRFIRPFWWGQAFQQCGRRPAGGLLPGAAQHLPLPHLGHASG